MQCLVGRPCPASHRLAIFIALALIASACATPSPSLAGEVEVLGSWSGEEFEPIGR
jgi:hypothetical protein